MPLKLTGGKCEPVVGLATRPCITSPLFTLAAAQDLRGSQSHLPFYPGNLAFYRRRGDELGRAGLKKPLSRSDDPASFSEYRFLTRCLWLRSVREWGVQSTVEPD